MEELRTLPIRYDLVISKNSDYASAVFSITNPDGTPVNITDYQIISQVREDSNINSDLIVDFEIARDDVNGKFQLTIPFADFNNITDEIGYYDIIIIDTLNKRKVWFFGSVSFYDTTTAIP